MELLHQWALPVLKPVKQMPGETHLHVRFLQAIFESIRNLMESMGWPVDQAMSALKAPEVDRPRYLERLGGQ